MLGNWTCLGGRSRGSKQFMPLGMRVLLTQGDLMTRSEVQGTAYRWGYWGTKVLGGSDPKSRESWTSLGGRSRGPKQFMPFGMRVLLNKGDLMTRSEVQGTA